MIKFYSSRTRFSALPGARADRPRNGTVRQRNSADQPRRGDAALVSRLRHERDRGPRAPNLLVNGSSGIAVGMATNIPPHNLGEVVDACLHVLAQPHCAIEEVIKLMPAPDFPTAGIIYGLGGVHEGYRTGRGRVVMRARTHFEEIGRGDRQAVIVDELPYQVNKRSEERR